MYPCCKMTPRLDGWWLVSEHDHCTCSPHMGAHEVGCGMTPDVKLDHLPGWDELVTAVTAIQQAEIDRLNDKLAWFETNFPCDGGCGAVNEVQGDCSQHGWTPQQLWDELDARTREWRIAIGIESELDNTTEKDGTDE